MADMQLSILVTAQNAASQIFRSLAGDIGAINPAGLAATAAIAGIGVAIGASVKAAADFQSGLTTLVTGAGELQSNLSLVSAGIKQISVDTGTSTQQLIAGMYMIESAGFHGAGGLQVLQAAAEGAKVGNADLGVVANTVTTVLHDYHMTADQATQATSALITTVADGKTHLQDLATSMGSVLPLASALGISFPQVAGAIAAMTNAGMDARRAAMNLANSIRSLSAPSGIAQKAMASVGLSAQQLKNELSTGGLTGVIQMVEKHVGQTFPANSVAAVTAFKNIMGGATGYNVALMLGGKNMAGYEANVKNITAALNSGAGSVQGWAQVQDDFNFKLDQARAALNVLMINIGTAFLPLLSRIMDAINPIIAGFVNWSSTLVTNKTALDVFIAVLAGLGAVIMLTVVPALWSMAAGVIAATWPFLLIGLAVTGAVLLITHIFNGLPASAQQWGMNMMAGFISGVQAMISDLFSILEQVAGVIAGFLGFHSPAKQGPGKDLDKWGPNMVKGLAKGIKDNAGHVGEAAEHVAKHLDKMHGDKDEDEDEQEKHKKHTASAASHLASGLTSGAGVVKAASTTLGSHLHAVCTHAHAASSCASTALTHHLASSIMAGHTHVKAAALSLGQILSTTLAGQTPAVQAATTKIAEYLQSMGYSAKSAASMAGTAIKTGLTAGVAGGAHAVQASTLAIEKYLMSMGVSAKDAAKAAGMALGPGLATQIQQGAALIPSALTKAKSASHGAATSLGQSIAQGITQPLQSIGTTVQKALAPVAAVAKPAIDAFKSASPVFSAIGKILGQIGGYLVTTFTPVWQQLQTTWKAQMLPALQQLWAALQPLLPVFKAIGALILTIIVIAFGLLVGVITGLVKGLAGFLTGLTIAFGGMTKIFTGIVQIASGAITFIYDLITGNFSKLGSDLKTWWAGIINIFSGAWDVVSGIFQGAINAIIGFVTGFIDGIKGFFITLFNDLVGHSIIPDLINLIIYWFMSLPTAIGNAFSGLGTLVHGIWDGIAAAIKGGINAVISAINGFIGFIDGIQIHIPSVGVGPFQTPAFNWNGLGIPKIPLLATGGYVQAGGLAIIHRGESVIPARVTPLGGGGGEVHHHYNITVNAMHREHTPQELATKVLDEISRKLNRSGGFATNTSGGRAF